MERADQGLSLGLKLGSDKERMSLLLKGAGLAVFGTGNNFKRSAVKDFFMNGA